MKLIDKMEKKIGKYAIHNISLYLIICYGFGYILQLMNPAFMTYLNLNPQLLLRGQVWRLVTWILIPPGSLDFFTIIMLMFYYSIGTSLERTWGTFRYNVYLISGMLFTILGSIVFYLLTISGIMGVEYLANYGDMFYVLVGSAFSTYYINMSIFLAYAATFPNMQVLLMFIIPIKVKWLGIAYGVLLGYQLLVGILPIKFAIAASLLNFVVFFLANRNMSHMAPKQIKRRHEYKKSVQKSTGITKHKCAICGRTETDDENLEFRFCSKCDGNYEYCQEHLFTHEHIRKH